MGKAHPARDVRGPGRQVLAVLGHQRHPHAGDRPGGLQGAHHRVQAVGALIGDHRHVGEHDPAAGLGRLLAGLVVGLGVPAARGVPGLDHIAAGLQLLQHRAQGEDGGRLGAKIALDRQGPLPHRPSLVVGAGVVVVGIFALAGGLGLGDLAADQVAVGHAPDLDGQARDVDGLDADPVGLLARQDHPIAGEAHIGRLVPEGEIDVLVLGQGLAALGRKALQQGDAVIGESQSADAELIAPGADRRRAARLGRDQHEVRVGLGGIQRPGHLDAGHGLGVGGIDPRPPHREAGGLLRGGAPGVGGPRMTEQRPPEPGLLARHAGFGAGVTAPRSLAEDESRAEPRQQRRRHRGREDLLVPVHGRRPRRMRAGRDGSLGGAGGQ